jgi:hypothetical protein
MQRTEALKFLIFFQKNLKKVLDIPLFVCYSMQARLRETAKTSKANLENDTEERTLN